MAEERQKLDRLRQEFSRRGAALSGEVKEKALGYIAAAFGLVAGLAWNDAIKALIEVLFPLQQDSVLVKFLYAIILTAVVVVITALLLRLFKRREEER